MGHSKRLIENGASKTFDNGNFWFEMPLTNA